MSRHNKQNWTCAKSTDFRLYQSCSLWTDNTRKKLTRGILNKPKNNINIFIFVHRFMIVHLCSIIFITLKVFSFRPFPIRRHPYVWPPRDRKLVNSMMCFRVFFCFLKCSIQNHDFQKATTKKNGDLWLLSRQFLRRKIYNTIIADQLLFTTIYHW